MPIKNKDGTVYKLRGPNPLMTQQVEWDAANVRMFNIGHKSEVVIDERSPVKEAQENVVNISEELNLVPNKESKIVPAKQFIQEIQEIQETQVEPEEKPVVLSVNPKTARSLKERKEVYFCAPCVGYKIHDDDFYGQSYKTVQFGDQFMFDAITIDQSDFQLQIWCIRELTKDSIIYRKDPEGGERWWRISKSEPKSDGHLVLADISDLNPDFS